MVASADTAVGETSFKTPFFSDHSKSRLEPRRVLPIVKIEGRGRSGHFGSNLIN
jgi:hypothetical protein